LGVEGICCIESGVVRRGDLLSFLRGDIRYMLRQDLMGWGVDHHLGPSTTRRDEDPELVGFNPLADEQMVPVKVAVGKTTLK
jgi:hypothetical protein